MDGLKTLVATDFGTVTWAAGVLRVSQRQVHRYIVDGLLERYTPMCGKVERKPVLVSVEGVRRLAAHRRALGRTTGDTGRIAGVKFR